MNQSRAKINTTDRNGRTIRAGDLVRFRLGQHWTGFGVVQEINADATIARNAILIESTHPRANVVSAAAHTIVLDWR